MEDLKQLMRVSQRAVKCDYCGMRGREGSGEALYWHKRPDVGYAPNGSYCAHTWNSRKHCRECGIAQFILLHEDSTAHKDRCSGKASRERERHEAPRDVDHWNDEPAKTPEPVPVPVPSTNGSVTDTELVRVLREALGHSVDPEQVREIVAESYGEHIAEMLASVDRKIAEIKAPTVVEVLDRRTFESKDLGLTHKVFPKVLKALQSGVHPWLVGPAGTGKTHIGHQCAEAMSLEFRSVSLTVTMPVSELVGYRDANGVYHGTAFRHIWEFGGVFLFDECDNGNANTLGKVNEALSNGSMEFPDARVMKHPDCFILAAANTYGTGADRQYVGRMQMDAAFLNRFGAKIPVPIDEALEDAIALGQGADPVEVGKHLARVRQVRRNAERLNLKLVISPRESISGAQLLAGGFTLAEVEEMTLKDAMSAQDWERVSG